MSDGSWEVQVAVYDLLSKLTPALASGGVHAPAPQDYEAFPYVEIGAADALADDVQGRDGLSETLTLHVWSRQPGQREAKQIIGRIRAALHMRTLKVPGRSTAFATIRTTRVFRDPDGVTQHGTVDLRVVHHQET